jgi:hypothetical protein
MKHTELNLTPKGYNFNTNIKPAKSHYKFLMRIGRCFPSTKAQARFFVSNSISFDELNYEDVQRIEGLLNKHGHQGDYKYTKSRLWARLQNHQDFYAALRAEYNF